MDPEKKQLIIMLGVVGILLVVVGFLMFRPSTTNSPIVIPEVSLPTDSTGATLPETKPSTSVVAESRSARPAEVRSSSPEEQDAALVSALSRSFAEFFGTYSTEGAAFQGVSLASMATQNFQDWFKTAWPKVQSALGVKIYHSLTARAISTKLITHDPVGGKASVEVTVQQEEVVGQVRSIQYRKLQVEALRQNDVWLVDKASWK